MMSGPDNFHGIVPLGKANIERRVVGKHGASANKNRIAHGAKFMVPAVGTLRGDFERRPF